MLTGEGKDASIVTTVLYVPICKHSLTFRKLSLRWTKHLFSLILTALGSLKEQGYGMIDSGLFQNRRIIVN